MKIFRSPYLKEYFVCTMFVIIVGSFLAVPLLSKIDRAENDRLKSILLSNVNSRGCSEILAKNRNEADYFKRKFENFHLQNIEKISISKNGDNFKVIVKFK